jgi:hypothetical protein
MHYGAARGQHATERLPMVKSVMLDLHCVVVAAAASSCHSGWPSLFGLHLAVVVSVMLHV